MWHGGGQVEAELLAGAYESTPKCADEHDCQSIAFKAISTGIFGYLLQAATDIAIKTVRENCACRSTPTRVIFKCFSDEVLESYRHSASGFDI